MSEAPVHCIVDTCTLFDFLALQYQSSFSVPWPSRCHLVTLTNDSHRSAFERFLAQKQNKVLTTTGVIAEIHRHICRARQMQAPGRRAQFVQWCWTFLCDSFRTWCVEEYSVSLLTLVDLAELGPVDASLVHLAKDQVAHGNVALVFTGDNKVRKRCVKEGIDCPFPVDILNRENTI